MKCFVEGCEESGNYRWAYGNRRLTMCFGHASLNRRVLGGAVYPAKENRKVSNRRSIPERSFT